MQTLEGLERVPWDPCPPGSPTPNHSWIRLRPAPGHTPDRLRIRAAWTGAGLQVHDLRITGESPLAELRAWIRHASGRPLPERTWSPGLRAVRTLRTTLDEDRNIARDPRLQRVFALLDAFDALGGDVSTSATHHLLQPWKPDDPLPPAAVHRAREQMRTLLHAIADRAHRDRDRARRQGAAARIVTAFDALHIATLRAARALTPGRSTAPPGPEPRAPRRRR